MTSLHDAPSALAAAVDHYSAAQAAHDALRELYDTPTGYRDPDFAHRVAGAHDAIRHGLKSAEVAASIAVALELVEIRPAATPRPRTLEGVEL